jgi:hypothetical protein
VNTQASVFAVPIVESFKGRHLSVRFRLKPIVAAGTFLDKSSNESVRMIPSGAMRVRSFMCCEHYKQRFTLHIILLSIAPPCAEDNIEKTKSAFSLPNTRHNYRVRILLCRWHHGFSPNFHDGSWVSRRPNRNSIPPRTTWKSSSPLRLK